MEAAHAGFGLVRADIDPFLGLGFRGAVLVIVKAGGDDGAVQIAAQELHQDQIADIGDGGKADASHGHGHLGDEEARIPELHIAGIIVLIAAGSMRINLFDEPDLGDAQFGQFVADQSLQ